MGPGRWLCILDARFGGPSAVHFPLGIEAQGPGKDPLDLLGEEGAWVLDARVRSRSKSLALLPLVEGAGGRRSIVIRRLPEALRSD